MLRAIQENGRGITDLAHARIGHGENTQLVDRTKPVLLPAQGSVAGIMVTLDQNRTIDHVLKHLRTRQATVFGDVADQNQYRTRLLCVARQLRRTVAHLRNAAGRRREGFAVQYLNRIHYQHFGFQRLSRR